MPPRTAVELALTRGVARGQLPLLRVVAVCLAAGLVLVPRWGFAAFAVACVPPLLLALLATAQRVVLVATLADVWEELAGRGPNDAASPRELDALAAVVANLGTLGVYPLRRPELTARLVAALPDDGPCLIAHRPLCPHTLPRQRRSLEQASTVVGGPLRRS